MKKILSILTVLFFVFQASAQTEVPKSVKDNTAKKATAVIATLKMTGDDAKVLTDALIKRAYDGWLQTKDMTTPEEKKVVWQGLNKDYSATLNAKFSKEVVKSIYEAEKEYNTQLAANQGDKKAEPAKKGEPKEEKKEKIGKKGGDNAQSQIEVPKWVKDNTAKKVAACVSEVELTSDEKKVISEALAKKDNEGAVKVKEATTPDERKAVWAGQYKEYFKTLDEAKISKETIDKVSAWEKEYIAKNKKD